MGNNDHRPPLSDGFDVAFLNDHTNTQKACDQSLASTEQGYCGGSDFVCLLGVVRVRTIVRVLGDWGFVVGGMVVVEAGGIASSLLRFLALV